MAKVKTVADMIKNWLRINISKENTKLGSIPSFSMPPVTTCRDDVWKFCWLFCYAAKAYKMYPNVRRALQQNEWVARYNFSIVGAQIAQYVEKHKPERFRWLVSGDIINTNMLTCMIELAEQFPKTKWLCFTKRDDILQTFSPADMPKNLRIILSVWPGMAYLEHVYKVWPKAFMHDKDNLDLRIDVTAKKCSGSCTKCASCWTGKTNTVFDLH